MRRSTAAGRAEESSRRAEHPWYLLPDTLSAGFGSVRVFSSVQLALNLRACVRVFLVPRSLSKTTLATDTGHPFPSGRRRRRARAVSAASEWGHELRATRIPHERYGADGSECVFWATRPFNSPLVFLAASANLFVGPTSCHQATKTAQATIYFYWEALGSRGQRESMMEDLEKTKPVAEPAMDDDETGAGCDVCMPPIALVGAEDYDYKYLCMPSMPWSKGGVEPPQFLAKDEKLPLTLSLIMGLQHALAMVAGRRRRPFRRSRTALHRRSTPAQASPRAAARSSRATPASRGKRTRRCARAASTW